MAYHILNDTETAKLMVIQKIRVTGHDYKVRYRGNQIEMEGEAFKKDELVVEISGLNSQELLLFSYPLTSDLNPVMATNSSSKHSCGD